MRARFGGYFLGQVATFMYLTKAMQASPAFDVAVWPQFSLYNLVVANFWPFFWVAQIIDSAKVDEAYWRVFAVAQDKVAGVLDLIGAVSGA